MKPLYLIYAALLLSSSVLIAKEPTDNNGSRQQTYRPATAGKTTTMQERVTGYSYRKLATGIVTDTCLYVYTGNRGSTPVDWFSAKFPNAFLPIQNMRCDTFTYKLAGTNERGSFKYNSSDQAIESKEYLAPLGSLRDHHYYEYDVAGRFKNDTQYFYPYNSSYKRYRTYDGSGYLVLDSMYNFTGAVPAEKNVYTNDAGGNPTLSVKYLWSFTPPGWVPSTQVISTYDAFGHETLAITQDYSGTTWTNNQKDTTYYPGSSDRFSYSATYSWASGAWQGTSARSTHINSANQWDTVYLYDWNSTTSAFDIHEKDYQLYTSYGNLQYAGGYLYNTGTGTYASAPYDLNIYYYETYNFTGVNDPAPSVATVKISPNPASGMLHLAMNDVASSGPLKVSIISITGQTMMQTDMSGTTDAAIDVSGYAPGIYIVTAMGESFQFRETFVKQ